jgi:hypothetical protein
VYSTLPHTYLSLEQQQRGGADEKRHTTQQDRTGIEGRGQQLTLTVDRQTRYKKGLIERLNNSLGRDNIEANATATQAAGKISEKSIYIAMSNTAEISGKKRGIEDVTASDEHDKGEGMDVDGKVMENNSIAIQVNEHTETTKGLLSSIDSIVEAFQQRGDSGKPATSFFPELLQNVAMQLMTLKSTQREATLMVEQKARKVQQRKVETESGHLVLQNLAYEKNHLLREISSCRDYTTTHLSQMTADETNDGDTHTESGSNKLGKPSSRNEDDEQMISKFVGHNVNRPKDRTQHQEVLDFITHDIGERTTLKQQLEEVKSERTKVEKESVSKRKYVYTGIILNLAYCHMQNACL